VTVASTAGILASAMACDYAVAAVNVIDDLSIRAVVESAHLATSPLIVQTSVKTVRSLGSDFLARSFERAAAQVDVPVSLHLDHCPYRDMITECLEGGWSSVLFDASDRSLDDALRETTEVVQQAHAVGASVESEIENISGVEDEIGSDMEGSRYPVDVVADFVATTGCDYFAPAVGTAHGIYASTPQLDPGRAAEIADRLRIPLVLHGGTGLSDADFRRFIDAGCHKVNLSTTLKRAYMTSARDFLVDADHRGSWDAPAMFAAIREAVATDLTPHFTIFGSAEAGGTR